MRVTLINPNLSGLACRPNLGLAYLISSIDNQHPVSLIDLTFKSRNWLDYIQKKLQEDSPEVVGISVTTFTFSAGLKIASLVKRLYPEVPVIFGGIHPTLLPEETLSHPEVDAVCIGEGEETFPEYLDYLQRHLSPKGVAGLWYKEDGRIIENAFRPFKEDLDSLPFPNWDYWEIEKYMKTDSYFTGGLIHTASRGCPYNCTFCSNPVIRKSLPGKYYRLRSPKNVIQEIKINREKYWHRGLRNIPMIDETFGSEQKQLDEFCELFVKEGLIKDLTWSCQTHIDVITENWAEKVAKAGCAMLTFGIEAGDDYIRTEVYNKKISYEKIVGAAKHLANHNIPFQIHMMVGGPEETRETINKSIKLSREINPLMTHFSFYQPLPKTELTQKTVGEISLVKDNFADYWNTPKKGNFNFKKGELMKIMWKIRFANLYNFFKQGFKFKKAIFISDIIKYIFSIGNIREISLRNPYLKIDIAQKTVHKYALENWKEKYKKL